MVSHTGKRENYFRFLECISLHMMCVLFLFFIDNIKCIHANKVYFIETFIVISLDVISQFVTIHC